MNRLHSRIECKILTWNVWCHYFVKAPRRQSRLEKIVEYIKTQSYDVICIQELFTLKILGLYTKSNEVEWFISTLKDLGYKYHTNPFESNPYIFGQNSGLLILSKTKIKESFSKVFNTTSEFNNKGYVCTTIEINGVDVCVCTAHLDAFYNNVKAIQVKEIQESLQKHYKEEKPIIMVGDLNICSRYMPDLYKYLSDEFSKLGLVNAITKNHETYISGLTLDHIFVSKEFISVDNISTDLVKDDELGILSDHYAVSAILHIRI